MIQSIKEAIVNRLLELYPDCTVYDEDMPLEFQKPSFLINVTSQNYVKLLQDKFKNQLTFDIFYYSNATEEIKKDCLNTGLVLLTGFDRINNYRLRNKKAETIDKVLHFTFEIHYSVRKEEMSAKMQEQETKTNL